MVDSLRESITVVAPELAVLGGATIGLLGGLFLPKRMGSGFATFAAVIGLILGAALVLYHFQGDPRAEYSAFGGAFRSTSFIAFAKIVAISCAAIVLLMGEGHRARFGLSGFEFAPLIGLASAGLMVMLSADDLIVLYLGVEMLSLPSYVLAAFARDDRRATEAGLKYFVLGALASGFILYGSSLVYGFTGAIDFAGIAAATYSDIPLLFGLVFIICGLAFKCSAAPFHMWTPDVYEGAPLPVVAFFASAPKMAAVAIFARVLFEPFGPAFSDWAGVLQVIAAISMVWGAIGALTQKNIKRLLAYSSINNVGFALMAIATGPALGGQAVLLYMGIYSLTVVGVFAGLAALRGPDGAVETLDGFKGLSKSRPGMAIAMTILFFSIAGVPPLLGFWGKLYVFTAALEAGYVALWAIACVATVVAAGYYLILIARMWFDEPVVEIAPRGPATALTMDLAAIFVLVGLGFFGIIESSARIAAGQ